MDVDRRPGGTLKRLSPWGVLHPAVLKMLQRAYQSHMLVCVHMGMHGFFQKAIIAKLTRKTNMILKKSNKTQLTYASPIQ